MSASRWGKNDGDVVYGYCWVSTFLCQAEDGIRDLVRSRGLGDVYKRQRKAGGTSSQDVLLRRHPVYQQPP